MSIHVILMRSVFTITFLHLPIDICLPLQAQCLEYMSYSRKRAAARAPAARRPREKTKCAAAPVNWEGDEVVDSEGNTGVTVAFLLGVIEL
jgi:hypothetical protein